VNSKLPKGLCIPKCNRWLQDARYPQLDAPFIEAVCDQSVGCVARLRRKSSPCALQGLFESRQDGGSTRGQANDKQESGREEQDVFAIAAEVSCSRGVGEVQQQQQQPPQRQQQRRRQQQHHQTLQLQQQEHPQDVPSTALWLSGVNPGLSLEDVLGVINQAGFGGTYNYAYLPTLSITNEWGKGYLIINFIARLYLDIFLEHLRASPTALQEHLSDEGQRLCWSWARTQGYSSYVSEKRIQNVLRLRNRRMWPFMATADGARLILAPWVALSRRLRLRREAVGNARRLPEA